MICEQRKQHKQQKTSKVNSVVISSMIDKVSFEIDKQLGQASIREISFMTTRGCANEIWNEYLKTYVPL